MKKNKRTIKKKGTIADLFYVVVVLFTLFIILITSYKVFDDITIEMNASRNDGMMSDQSIDMMTSNKDRYITIFDYAFLFIFGGLQLALLISAFWIRTHPMYFVVALILIALLAFVTFQISNIADEFGMDSDYVGIYEEFNIMRYIMRNLPILEIIFGFVTLIVLYMKGGYE